MNPKYQKYFEASPESEKDNKANVSVDATEIDDKTNAEANKALNITPATIKNGQVKEELMNFFKDFENGSAKTTITINSKTINLEIVVKAGKVQLLSADLISMSDDESDDIRKMFKKSELGSADDKTIKIFMKKSMTKEAAIEKIDSVLSAIALVDDE